MIKSWDQTERLKTIKHLADLAKNDGRHLVARGQLREAAELLVEGLSCIQLLTHSSDEVLWENRARIARFWAAP